MMTEAKLKVSRFLESLVKGLIRCNPYIERTAYLFCCLSKNTFLVKRAIEILNTGDLSRVSEFINRDYFNHESQRDPVRSKMRGPEKFTDAVKNIRRTITYLHYEEVETLTSHDNVISVVTVTGKHTVTFFDFIPATDNNISYKAVHIHTIGDGKIVEHRAIRDDLALMYQLGVVKASLAQYEDFWKNGKVRNWVSKRKFDVVSLLSRFSSYFFRLYEIICPNHITNQYRLSNNTMKEFD